MNNNETDVFIKMWSWKFKILRFLGYRFLCAYVCIYIIIVEFQMIDGRWKNVNSVEFL